MILVTGCNGMLGNYINWEHTFKTDIYDLDVSNEKDVARYNKFDASCIVHLAAETDLEMCEKDAVHAYKVNVIGTVNMTRLADRLEVPIVYISTAGVFSGDKIAPYIETDEPDPINIYGLTKWYGELVVGVYPKHHILRAGWMMGGVLKDKKFVGKIMNKIRSGVKEIYAINDVWGSPTYAKDLARVIKSAVNHEFPYGTYHSCGSGRATRYDVACEVVKQMGAKVKVIPITTKGYGTKDSKHSTTRSANEMMSIKKLESTGLGMRSWKVALKEYMGEWQNV
jgi:dTDP-4-dehydrorhamnose reductase